jgi:ribokinase
MPASGAREGLRLAVLGAVNWDTTVFEERFAEPGEEVPALRVEDAPGGKGANAAVAAARILGTGSVAFIGALGEDSLKAPLLESLASEGVKTDGVAVIKRKATGRAFVLVDSSGRKTVHTIFGANDALEPKHLSTPAASATLEAVPMVVTMDVPLRVARSLKPTLLPGTRLVYSPGVRSLESPGALSPVLAAADILVVDRAELENMCRGAAPEDGVKSIQRRCPGLVVVATLGPRGSLVADGGPPELVDPVDLGDLGLRAVNSTGSGDAFLGAFASYLLLGASVREAAGWGNLAGALKATKAETRGSPTRVELEGAMATLNGFRRRRPA